MMARSCTGIIWRNGNSVSVIKGERKRTFLEHPSTQPWDLQGTNQANTPAFWSPIATKIMYLVKRFVWTWIMLKKVFFTSQILDNFAEPQFMVSKTTQRMQYIEKGTNSCFPPAILSVWHLWLLIIIRDSGMQNWDLFSAPIQVGKRFWILDLFIIIQMKRNWSYLLYRQ